METLGERLEKALAASEKTQTELAAALGISKASVSDWITGKTKNIRMANLVTAAKILDVRTEWLASGKGEMRASGLTADEQRLLSLFRRMDSERQEETLRYAAYARTISNSAPIDVSTGQRPSKALSVHETRGSYRTTQK